MINALRQRIEALDTTCVRIGNIVPHWTDRKLSTGLTRRQLDTVEVEGRSYKVTDRFTKSLALSAKSPPRFAARSAASR